jgi:hypothetical protein
MPGHSEAVATQVCDDGALNGTYGRCNRTCSGFGGTCCDATISPGEMCDLGEQNGAYCNTAGGCNLTTTCGADCRSQAPYCGDRTVQSGEQCDGSAPETTTDAVPGQSSCVGVGAGLCAGGSSDGESCSCSPNTPGTTCASTSCGGGGNCVVYRTQHTRTCINTGITPIVGQCTWNDWSACQPVGQCGDGVSDPGEDCDDGNATITMLVRIAVRPISVEHRSCRMKMDMVDQRSYAGADYGSTCVACTTQCRMTASSGGYCGNGRRDGSEQCDGNDLGSRTSLSCQSLGFDYAEGVSCSASRYTTRDNGTITSIGPTVCCATVGGRQVAGDGPWRRRGDS